MNTRVVYTEPLGNYFYMEASYNFSFSQSNTLKKTYDSAADDNWTGINYLTDPVSRIADAAGTVLDQLPYTSAGEVLNDTKVFYDK